MRGSIPDMTSDSDRYIQLQQVYREQADREHAIVIMVHTGLKSSIFFVKYIFENCRIVLRSPWKVLEFYLNLPVWTLHSHRKFMTFYRAYAGWVWSTQLTRGLFENRCFTFEGIYTRHDGRLGQIYPVTAGLQRASRQRWYNSHRLEKFLNLEGYLEKSLKIKYALKSTGKSLQSLEKSWNSSIFWRS